MTNFKRGEPLPCAEMEGSTEQARPPAKQEQRSPAEASLGTSAPVRTTPLGYMWPPQRRQDQQLAECRARWGRGTCAAVSRRAAWPLQKAGGRRGDRGDDGGVA
jgi:hypothetical protein